MGRELGCGHAVWRKDPRGRGLKFDGERRIGLNGRQMSVTASDQSG